MKKAKDKIVWLCGLLLVVVSAGAETCIVSGVTARAAAGQGVSSAAAGVVGGGTVSAGASAPALEVRDGTEAASGGIPLNTRAPRGVLIFLT